jgi:dipeptidase D
MDAFAAAAQAAFDTWKEEFKVVEVGAVIEMTADVEEPLVPSTLAATHKALAFLNAIPFGPQRMLPGMADAVETSFTMAIVRTEEETLKLIGSARSSSDTQLVAMHARIHSLCGCSGVRCSGMEDAYPGWSPKMDSKVLHAAKSAALEVYGKDPHVYSVHAGLECGCVQAKYPAMECVSIGPTIESPHSPDERLFIPSVQRFYDVLVKLLEKLTA